MTPRSARSASFRPRVAAGFDGSSVSAFSKKFLAALLDPWASAWRPKSVNWFDNGGSSAPKAETPDSSTPPSIRNPAPLDRSLVRDMFGALQQKDLTGSKTGSGARCSSEYATSTADSTTSPSVYSIHEASHEINPRRAQNPRGNCEAGKRRIDGCGCRTKVLEFTRVRCRRGLPWRSWFIMPHARPGQTAQLEIPPGRRLHECRP